MKFVKFLLKAAVVLGVLFLILGFFAKKSYQISRSIEIKAPKELVYEHIRSFKKFDKWSTWNELDTNAVITYGGEDGTTNSTYTWKGNESIGEGVTTMTAITPDQIKMMVDMQRPLKINMPVQYDITGDTNKTKVSLTINPTFSFPTNVWAMFTDVDKAFGRDYERALGQLKKVTEHIHNPMYNGYKVYAAEVPAIPYIGFRDSVKYDDMPAFFTKYFGEISAKSAAQKLTPAGAPMGLYWTIMEDTTKFFDVAAVFPFADPKATLDSLTVFTLGGPSITVDYLGGYDKTYEAYQALKLYMKEKKLEPVLPAVETYITDPEAEQDTAKWLTKVTYFVKIKQ